MAPLHSTPGTDRTAAPATGPADIDGAPWVETLRDGSHVLIRPIRKEDLELERAFIQRLSPQSRRMRFLGQMSSPGTDLLRHLTDIDYRREMAFIALVHRDGEKQEVGVSRYSVGSDGKSCECAVTVDDAWQDLGLGTLLMRHLIDVARSRGIVTMVSYDAADNLGMRDLATHLGFTRETDPDDRHQVIHRLQL
jgi:GNAT superfamily N-acetyltransferase